MIQHLYFIRIGLVICKYSHLFTIDNESVLLKIQFKQIIVNSYKLISMISWHHVMVKY